MTTRPPRYTITAIVTYHETEKRHDLGGADLLDRAMEMAAENGARHYPLLSSVAMFDLEVIDTTTGAKIPAAAAAEAAYQMARAMPTVADVGYW